MIVEVMKSTYVYKKINNHLIQADVYRTTDDIIKPAILYIHGGALIMGSRSWLDPVQTNLYLDAGYTLISIDYRLAPQAKLIQIIEDLEDAYRWIRSDGQQLLGIDPSRIAVVGHSAGGYLSLMAGFCFQPQPRAIVSFYGYGDIVGEWYCQPDPFYCQQPLVTRDDAVQSIGKHVVSEDSSGDRERFYLYTRQQGIWPEEVVGHDPAQEPEAFDSFCPVRNLSKDYPPTLLLHGDQDTDVPHEQSLMMAEELEKSGVYHEMISLEGLGHGFDGEMQNPKIARTFDRVLMFLENFLK
jgi:acetyl esterase/lipase